MSKKILASLIDACFKGRFLFLLVSLLGYLILTPLFEGFIGIRLLLGIFTTAVFITAIYAASQKKLFSVIGLLLALPMIACTWSTYFVEISSLLLVGNCFGILFFAFAVVNILSFVFKQHEVTLDVIYGAIVVYLLIAMMWALIFSLVESLQPGSFTLAQSQIQDSNFPFYYYSFVTITTLGYGEITPVTDIARSFAFLEAVVGQIYLVVLVARLVGINIAQSIERRSR
ncbi:MAG: two pore domain potassium channel family protein [Deltaproteobacteria bacterium]|nr:two pore domain potassium channel family protein [Deltaproteobacteria bacterium]MCK5513611.1 two pore domain potassium channel family protein [Deltaproteobacteria bacterium]